MRIARVLIVDDEPLVLDGLSRLLETIGCEVETASDGIAAREALTMREIDVVVADIAMPRLTGTELLRWIHEKQINVRVILVTGQPDLESATLAVRAGAFDYVAKPPDPDNLQATVLKAIADRRREAVSRHIDPSTGLPRVTILREVLSRKLEAKESLPGPIAVYFLHLDGVSSVSGTSAENLLSAMGRALANLPQPILCVARITADVFCVATEDLSGSHACYLFGQQILEAIHKCWWNQARLVPGVCIGGATYPEHGRTPELLLANAEKALADARRMGAGVIRFYEPDIEIRQNQTRDIKIRLHSALAERTLRVLYQPKFNTRSRRMTGVEALLRLDDVGAPLGPGQFIPVAEETGLIEPITDFLLTEVIAFHKRRHALNLPRLPVAVNISSRTIGRDGFAERILGYFLPHGSLHELIEIEITETAVLEASDSAFSNLQKLRLNRVPIALDDFGTGYSSLHHVHQLPIQKLKIDGSFVRAMQVDSRARAIVKSVIDLAHGCGLQTIAEGVETIEQLEQLLELGCHEIQGYLFAAPKTEADLLECERKHNGSTITGVSV